MLEGMQTVEIMSTIKHFLMRHSPDYWHHPALEAHKQIHEEDGIVDHTLVVTLDETNGARNQRDTSTTVLSPLDKSHLAAAQYIGGIALTPEMS